MRVVAIHFRERETAEAAMAEVRVLTGTPAHQWSLGPHDDGWVVAGRYPAAMRHAVLRRYRELGGSVELDVPFDWTQAGPVARAEPEGGVDGTSGE